MPLNHCGPFFCCIWGRLICGFFFLQICLENVHISLRQSSNTSAKITCEAVDHFLVDVAEYEKCTPLVNGSHILRLWDIFFNHVVTTAVLMCFHLYLNLCCQSKYRPCWSFMSMHVEIAYCAFFICRLWSGVCLFLEMLLHTHNFKCLF